jgi:nucleotide-binding universal stress UspA family protein
MKILIPIDDSEQSLSMLTWATQFLNPGNSHICLLHIIPFLPDCPPETFMIEHGIELLNRAKALLKNAGFEAVESNYLVETGSVGRAICRYADEKEVDQIVMGSHGRGALASLLMGSVSQEVFRQAHQPVVIISNGPRSSLRGGQPEQAAILQP